ncbi:MAG: hypothetical protein U0791_23185 [Gemmataceae bacterium]
MSPIVLAILAALGPLIDSLAKKAAAKVKEWLNDLFTKASKNLAADAAADDVFDEAIRLTRSDRKLRLGQRVKRTGMLRLFKVVHRGTPTKHDKDELNELVSSFE